MSSKRALRWLILAAASFLLIQAGYPSSVWGQAEKLTWDREVKVTRKAKPGRKAVRRRPRFETVPLLTIEYRVMKEAEDLTPKETNPGTVFHTGDRIQIKIKPNQEGYLYIIQSTEGEDGQIIFPDSRIDDGRNLVAKNKEHTIPSICQTRYLDKLGNCWLEMQPPTGREIFTVIFSRDLITELDEVAGSGGVVSRSVIDNMLRGSKQMIRRTSKPQGIGAGRFVVWVSNMNRRDNEELITEIVLLHKEREGSN